MKQIEILLKCYYLKKYTRVAANENMTLGKVKQIKEKALRIIRLSYSQSHMKGLRFDEKNVLNYMAERSGMEFMTLFSIFETYIEEGMASDNKKYWVRIRGEGAPLLLPNCWTLYMINTRLGLKALFDIYPFNDAPSIRILQIR